MNKKRCKDDKIIITCIGKNSTQVTGSCNVVSYPKDDGTRGIFIIEMGLPQGGHSIEEQFRDMKSMTTQILSSGCLKTNDINTSVNATFLHSHVDHTGLLALLNSDNGFNGKIYCSKASEIISKHLIKDCYKIHNGHVNYLKSKGKKITHIYTEPQMYDMFDKMFAVDIDKEIMVDSNLKIKLRNNSHTVDSCNLSVYCKIPSTKRWKSILFTSDLGSKINYKLSDYLKEQDISIEHYNIVFSEATYAKKDTQREMTKQLAIDERRDLKQRILNDLKQGKRVLCPTFSFSRSQQLITYFYEWFKDDEWIKNNDIQFVMDSNLMNNINKAYMNILEGEELEKFQKVMNWNKLKKIDTFDGTMAFLSQKKASVVLSSSGFLTNGKVVTYLQNYLDDSNSDIILTGYCDQYSEGTMGYKLTHDDIKIVKLDGVKKEDKHTLRKNASIKSYKTFSSHISRQELLDLFVYLNTDKIVVQHCNKENKEEFIKNANEYVRSKNKTTKIVGSFKDAQFVI